VRNTDALRHARIDRARESREKIEMLGRERQHLQHVDIARDTIRRNDAQNAHSWEE
jgi:hypothetical protein